MRRLLLCAALLLGAGAAQADIRLIRPPHQDARPVTGSDWYLVTEDGRNRTYTRMGSAAGCNLARAALVTSGRDPARLDCTRTVPSHIARKR